MKNLKKPVSKHIEDTIQSTKFESLYRVSKFEVVVVAFQREKNDFWRSENIREQQSRSFDVLEYKSIELEGYIRCFQFFSIGHHRQICCETELKNIIFVSFQQFVFCLFCSWNICFFFAIFILNFQKTI